MKLRVRFINWLLHILNLTPEEACHGIVTEHDLSPRELWPDELDPIKKALQFDDDPGTVIAWIMGPDATDGDIQDWAATLNSIYIQRFGHVPRAVHIPVRNIQDVRKLSTSEQDTLLKPWLRQGTPSTE